MAKSCACTSTPKITFRLEKWEHAVVFQVISVDKRFKEGESFRASNGIRVDREFGCSMIAEDSVDLGDETEVDPATLSFDSNDERDTYYDRLLEALKEWAQTWEGFKGPDNSAPANGQVFSVFTF